MARASPLQQQAAPNPTKSRISSDWRVSSGFVAIHLMAFGNGKTEEPLNKFYVALSRAKYSIALIVPDAIVGNGHLPVWLQPLYAHATREWNDSGYPNFPWSSSQVMRDAIAANDFRSKKYTWVSGLASGGRMVKCFSRAPVPIVPF